MKQEAETPTRVGKWKTIAGETLLRAAEFLRGKEFYTSGRAAAEIALLYPGKAGQIRLRRFYAEKLYRAAAAVVLGIVLSIAAAAMQPSILSEDGSVLRETYGGRNREIELTAVESSGRKVPIRTTVSARKRTAAQAEALLEETILQLDLVVLSGNSDWDHVEEDLFLPEQMGDVQILWESGNFHVMNSSGRLNQEEIPKEGISFSIQGTLLCEERSKVYTRQVTVYPHFLTEEEQVQQHLQDAVRQAEEQQVYEESLQLPTEVDDAEIIWKEPDSGLLPILLILTVVMAMGLYWNEDQKLHTVLAARALQLDADYAEIINKMVLLLGAGMTVRAAWVRIAQDYMAHHKVERYAYEEMVLSMNELQRGIPEIQVYEHFGRRCGNASYLKFSALLTQNLRKGTRGLLELFRHESADAFQRQKNEVRKKGEEAGTRLLLPMFLMLADVLMIVMVPAFLSMQL